MLTTKKIIVPIYRIPLTIHIFDDWSEVKSALPEEERENESRAITWTDNNNRFSTIGTAINFRHKLSAIHEAEHIKNFIWSRIGYIPSADNDEVDAYLITYIYSKISDIITIHTKDK